MQAWPFVVLLALVSACIDTGQEHAAVLLYARGTSATEPILGKGDWSIELRRAEVAFGPLYLCAGAQAGALCDTARLEWLESAVVDAIEPEPREVGALQGVTGPVKSWMCDLGITSLLTQESPWMLDAAQELGGHSVVLEGLAEKPPHSVTFRVQVPVQQEPGAEVGASILRKGTSESFDHDVSGTEDTLTVQFDPRTWVAAIDFEEMVHGQACEADGCTLDVTLGPESAAGTAVRTAVLAGKRPSFSWNLGH